MKKPTRSGAVAKSAHLLDTSTLLWGLGEPERLSSKARRLIESGDNVVSVASYWEVVIKSQKGLLAIADLPSWWRRATELTAARVLPIRASHVTALATLPTIHRDPFDRILIAQALAEGLGFVTNDEPIRQYPVNTLW
jgi:PIN domain nuclease of toxin-antitoxin system